MIVRIRTIKVTDPDARQPTMTVSTLAKFANSMGGREASTTQVYGVPANWRMSARIWSEK